MFAISIRILKKKLYLFTDHFGIKPIYYTKYNDNWFFSSEIMTKSFIPHHHFKEDKESVAKF